MPEGSYDLVARHHGNKYQQTLTVKAGSTNHFEVQFKYGVALLETEPAGATVIGMDGRELGTTPLPVSDIPAGRWNFQLRLAGYETVSTALEITAQATNTFRANLVNLSYTRALNTARQSLAASEYDDAMTAAAEALQVKPNDPDAIALRNQAFGKKHIRQAGMLGKQGDYIGACRELELALKSLPENEEARSLLAVFKQQESKQVERQE